MTITRFAFVELLQQQLGETDAESLMKFAMPYAEIAFVESNGNIAVGSSKYGGDPDVPPGFEWPHRTTFRGSTSEGQRYPLTFVAQINFAKTL